ncbi:MAG: hypothetical protein J5632_06230 [Bacteroidales bacterium]|nr:hypothetical protein [Bacteroidales bacterium]
MKKSIVLILAAVLAIASLSSCVNKYKKVKIVSCDVESFIPSGLKSFNAVAKVGIDNPAPDFNIKNIRAVVRRDTLEVLYMDAENVAVDAKCNKVYRVPVAGQLSKSVSLIQLVVMAKNLQSEIDAYKVDITGRATVAGNIGKDIKYKDVPLKKFIDRL